MPSKLPKKSRARTDYVGTAYGAGYLNNWKLRVYPPGGGGGSTHIYTYRFCSSNVLKD